MATTGVVLKPVRNWVWRKGYSLPAGLTFHCESCSVVIPADAPTPAAADCAWLVRNKMGSYNPNETLAGQHAMAVCAWEYMHWHALRAADAASPEAVYLQHYKTDRLGHFAASAVRAGMSAEDVAAHATVARGRDAWLFAGKAAK